MGMTRFEPFFGASCYFAKLDVQGSEVETLRHALQRVIDEGVEAIRKRMISDRSFEENAKSCRSAVECIGHEYQVVNGDDWCRRKSCGRDSDNSVDIIAPVTDKNGIKMLLVEGKIGCTAPRRHPSRLELEDKYRGTSVLLEKSGVRIEPILHVIVSDNIRASMKWRIGNWMRGSHDIQMVSFCIREFLENLGLLPCNRAWSLT